jgi:hypothetical protein
MGKDDVYDGSWAQVSLPPRVYVHALVGVGLAFAFLQSCGQPPHSTWLLIIVK